MRDLGVIQVIDSLALGGLEMMAVNLANGLADRGVRSHLCATRLGGPLEARLSPGVRLLHLQRKGRVDWPAIRRLANYLEDQRIDLVHAHGSSLFCSVLTQLFTRRGRLLWHVHLGRHAANSRPPWSYRLAVRRARGVITVNEPLAAWARTRLKVPADCVWHLPNFVGRTPATPVGGEALPGVAGKRVVCVANLRPEKDHLTLIDAFSQVMAEAPEAVLLLVGDEFAPAHSALVRERIRRQGLDRRVFLLGSRTEVRHILRQCDVGVLSSVSEGMPLALLEYGQAGLAVVATEVGQVPEVLGGGRWGRLVSPGQPVALAQALVDLLRSPEQRRELGSGFARQVAAQFGADAVMPRIMEVYATVCGERVESVRGPAPMLEQVNRDK